MLSQGNLLIIPKIGVKIPIVEGEDEKSSLDKGAWRLPETSTPDKGSNTVLSGHRWKYRPPSEKTFYLLDKLEIGDSFRVYWEGKKYEYKVTSIAVVLPTDVDILNPTQTPVVTLITCTPLFSTAKRLVVKGDLME
ncbi:MAG: sortase [Patescibacteria group bacterium]